ncbi:MAG: biotin synthase BioB [Fibrobacterales bacterium]
MIQELKNKVLNEEKITNEEVMNILKSGFDIQELFDAANEIREIKSGTNFEMCSIMNAKSGSCSEDCKFCTQSAHFTTNSPEYNLVDEEEALALAKKNEANGVHRFSLVTSGKGIRDKDFKSITKIYDRLQEETNINLCASLGLLSKEKADELVKRGVKMYHHNVETSRNFFPNIVTTHTYDQRVETIKNIQAAGMDLCCGGIIGMGESWQDRVDMAFEISELNIQSIPINVLNPMPGTPLQDAPPIEPEEALVTMAIFRFVNPRASIRFAGGRQTLNQEMQKLGLKAGINGALVGDHLTTIGSDVNQDKEMITTNGFDLGINIEEKV